jgi:hypothetical protein
MRVNWANGTDLQIIKERERNTFCQALSEIPISPVRSGSFFNLHRSQFVLRGLTRTEREGPRFDLRNFRDVKAVITVYRHILRLKVNNFINICIFLSALWMVASQIFAIVISPPGLTAGNIVLPTISMLVLVFRVPVLQNRIGALELSISSKSVPGRKSSHPNSGWCTRCKGILAAGINEVCPTSPQVTCDSGTFNLKSTKLENLNTDGSKKDSISPGFEPGVKLDSSLYFKAVALDPSVTMSFRCFLKTARSSWGRTTGCWSHRPTQELNDHRLGSLRAGTLILKHEPWD